MKLNKSKLKFLYHVNKKSTKEIATLVSCSENKINYWLKKYGIPKRSIGDSLYIKHNPKGDPFRFVGPKDRYEHFLFGLGLGLYWGEGNKKNVYSVRLGNTDPALIKAFISFLKHFYVIKNEKIKYNLQIFSDMSSEEAIRFWVKTLKVKPNKIGTPVITKSGKSGTYKDKTKHGVLTVSVSNKKLKNLISSEIDKLQKIHYST